MKNKPSESAEKRLKALESRKTENKPYAIFPEILSIEEWEALAIPMQQTLMRETQLVDSE